MKTFNFLCSLSSWGWKMLPTTTTKESPPDLILSHLLHPLPYICVGIDPMDLTWLWDFFHSTLMLQLIFSHNLKCFCVLPLKPCWIHSPFSFNSDIWNKQIHYCNQQGDSVIPLIIQIHLCLIILWFPSSELFGLTWGNYLLLMKRNRGSTPTK